MCIIYIYIERDNTFGLILRTNTPHSYRNQNQKDVFGIKLESIDEKVIYPSLEFSH